MADMVLSAVADAATKLSDLLRRLPPGSSSSLSTVDSCDEIQREIQGMSRMVVRIRARLDDAERWVIGDESVRLWLRELEGVAYDAEDVMEELLYHVANLQLDGCGSPPTGHVEELTEASVREMGKMALQRIQEINSRFGEISEHRVALQLEVSEGWRRVEPEIPARQQSSPLMNRFHIVGRENDLKVVKDFLLSDAEPRGSNNIPVMAIVGMGGLGKTTLAQLAYNDGEISKRFDLKSWVCVSEDFDLVRLMRDMIYSFTGIPSQFSQLDALQNELKEKLGSQRCLLVLDDVWEQGGLVNTWDRLILPLQSESSRGSKIMMTTRSAEVSRIAGAVLTLPLPCLQYEHCLEVFSQRAFEGRDLELLHPELKAMGEEISKRCGGVPLVAEIIGGQLRWIDDEQKWKEILEGDIWDIDKHGIMPVLRLSYDLLPAHLKRCFRYCSLFPKYYGFDKDRLVMMWMAHDYINPRGATPMEDIGISYFNELLGRSFFQSLRFGTAFQMHDLIHDLARYVARDECGSLEDGKPYNTSGRDVRHFSVICNGDPNDAMRPIQLPATLRSFVFINNSLRRVKNMEPLQGAFTVTKYLRVLDLVESEIEYLPNSIGCLKLLRYLGLPDSVTEYSVHRRPLQLPDSILQLLNLRHLIYRYGVIYPAGIGKLINLQTMPCFCVSPKVSHASLGEMKDIRNIRSLHISGIDKSISVGEAKMACLDKKEHLLDLHLEWRSSGHFDDELLESFKPNLTLRGLHITGFLGHSLPSWLGVPSFSKLSSVELTCCSNWTSLPCLGQLPQLKRLSIYRAIAVECIGRDFFLGGFPRLETLKLKSMDNLKSCCGVKKGECPCLRELVICDCPILKSFSLIKHPSLQRLWIDQCSFLQEWCRQHKQQLLHIPTLDVEGMNNSHIMLKNVLVVQEAAETSLRAMVHLQTLELEWDGDDSLLSRAAAEPEDVLQSLRPHTNLKKLVIRGYVGSRFATWLGDASFSNLFHVTLLQCSQCVLLPSLGQLPQLQELHISAANSLKHVGSEFFFGDSSRADRLQCAFPSLRNLEFQDLPIWEEWVGAEDGDLPRLNKLTIRHCPRLRTLPPHLPRLKELELGVTEQLMFPTSLINLSSLQSLQISDLPSLIEMPRLPNNILTLVLKNLPAVADLQISPSLRDLAIEGCNDMAMVALLPCLTNLTSLRLSQLPELTQPLPLHNMVALQKLDISGCPKLRSLDCCYFSELTNSYEEGLQTLESLRSLSLTDCPELNFSASDRPPSALRYLALTRCPQILPWCDRDPSRLTHVDEIWVDRIPAWPPYMS